MWAGGTLAAIEANRHELGSVVWLTYLPDIQTLIVKVPSREHGIGYSNIGQLLAQKVGHFYGRKCESSLNRTAKYLRIVGLWSNDALLSREKVIGSLIIRLKTLVYFHLIDERLPLKLAQTLGASLTSKDEMFLQLPPGIANNPDEWLLLVAPMKYGPIHNKHRWLLGLDLRQRAQAHYQASISKAFFRFAILSVHH
ncbi:hypothetical protein IFM5058_06507 [Aspergillus udagawae]|nr:hypothetical protein IFM5058_06507 [Aspergillus udagawae]